eukprot:gene19143-19511_t
MEDKIGLLEMTTEIVSAYVGHNSVSSTDLAGLIQSVHRALTHVDQPVAVEDNAPKEPAVPVKKSITPDFLICLEDGRKFKSLKRHLRTKFNMSPEDYRAKWGLPKDYPMVAPNYARARSDLAKQMGLGQGGRPAGPARRAGLFLDSIRIFFARDLSLTKNCLPTNHCLRDSYQSDSKGLWANLKMERQRGQTGVSASGHHEIDPRRLKSQLPTVSLIDVVRGEDGRVDYRQRLAGTGLFNVYGCEITGRRLSDVYTEADAAYWREQLDGVVASGRPAVGCQTITTRSVGACALLWMRLPLAKDGRNVDMILGYDSPVGGRIRTSETGIRAA